MLLGIGYLRTANRTPNLGYVLTVPLSLASSIAARPQMGTAGSPAQGAF
jgi:hypothetical protein